VSARVDAAKQQTAPKASADNQELADENA